MKLSKTLGISYPAAWHLGHRVRAMMLEANPMLSGVVEIDEMYAGALPVSRTGRGTNRPLVLVAAKRSAGVVAKVIPTHGKEAIASALDDVVDQIATVMTDGPSGLQAYWQDAVVSRGESLGAGIRTNGCVFWQAYPRQPGRIFQRFHASRRDRRVSLDVGEASLALYRRSGIPLEPEGRLLSVRQERFHRRPAITQSILRCGKTQRGPDVRSD